MTSKRLLAAADFRGMLLRAVLCGSTALAAILSAPAARADEVSAVSTLSQANRLSLFHDYSINAVGMTDSDIPGAPGGGVISCLTGNWTSTDATGTGRDYQLSASPIFGYDSNPEARKNDIGGEFGGADLNALYRFNFGPDDETIGHPGQIQVFYNLLGAAYSGRVFEADTIQQTAGAEFHRSLWDNTVVLHLLLDDQFTIEHADAFLNTFDAAPSAEVFVLPQHSIELGYDYTRLDYDIRTRLKKDPDANRHTLNFKYHFYPVPQKAGTPAESPDVLGDILRETLGRGTIGYDYIFNRSAGTDYVYDGNRVYIGLEGLQIPGAPDISFDARYAHEWDQYKNPNYEGPLVISGKPYARKRKDHIDVFTLRANARLMDFPHNRGTLSSFLQYDIIADRATIANRHYNEYAVTAGLTYQY